MKGTKMDMDEAIHEQWLEDVEISQIDEDDLGREWEEVKDKYPNISKEEFELAQKEFQEM